MLDCGPRAGNHGHFDLLSVEVAAFGRSLIVDPGRYTYHEAGEVNWRGISRHAMHNTVAVDGRNQTRYELAACRSTKVRGACRQLFNCAGLFPSPLWISYTAGCRATNTMSSTE